MYVLSLIVGYLIREAKSSLTAVATEYAIKTANLDSAMFNNSCSLIEGGSTKKSNISCIEDLKRKREELVQSLAELNTV